MIFFLCKLFERDKYKIGERNLWQEKSFVNVSSLSMLSTFPFKLASTETQKYGRFRGMAGFVRLPLHRIARKGLKNWPIFREGWLSEGPV
jgi:hypothetical protein